MAGTWTKNTATANLTYLDSAANNDYRHLLAIKDWPFLTRNRTVSTTAATQFTTMPYDCDIVREISVIPTGSTIRYTPRAVASREQWDQLNLRAFVSDIPEWYYPFNGQIGLWPTPASTGNTIYVTQKTRVIDLSMPDYTMGNIVSIANGASAVVGSGTTWTNQMVGRWISITLADTANTGDGMWYEIAAVPSTTTLTLVRAYGSNSISAGSAAYTIGQVGLLPEGFQDMPWMYAAGEYWQKEADNDGRAKFFLDQHGKPAQGNYPATGYVRDLIVAYSSDSSDMVLDHGVEKPEINPNLLISL